MKWYLTWLVYSTGEIELEGFEDFSSRELAKERIKELKELHGTRWLTYTLIYGTLAEES